MFNQITGCKTITNRYHVVYTLEEYTKHGYLRTTTYFITFNIINICTKFSHEKAIKALEHFLHIYGSELHTVTEGLSKETIIQLVRFILKNQFFIYENKLYQQTHGNASGSLLTIPLACIYLFFGESSLSIQTIMKNKQELFGRYI